MQFTYLQDNFLKTFNPEQQAIKDERKQGSNLYFSLVFKNTAPIFIKPHFKKDEVNFKNITLNNVNLNIKNIDFGYQ